MARDGRPTIFRSPGEKVRYQGIVTRDGSAEFERARMALAKLVGVKSDHVSDGAVIEYLARGDRASRVYIKNARK